MEHDDIHRGIGLGIDIVYTETFHADLEAIMDRVRDHVDKKI